MKLRSSGGGSQGQAVVFSAVDFPELFHAVMPMRDPAKEDDNG